MSKIMRYAAVGCLGVGLFSGCSSETIGLPATTTEATTPAPSRTPPTVGQVAILRATADVDCNPTDQSQAQIQMSYEQTLAEMPPLSTSGALDMGTRTKLAALACNKYNLLNAGTSGLTTYIEAAYYCTPQGNDCVLDDRGIQVQQRFVA